MAVLCSLVVYYFAGMVWFDRLGFSGGGGASGGVRPSDDDLWT